MRTRHLVLPCFLLLLAAGSPSAASPQLKPRAAAEFVRRSCRSTTFPRACERSLMPSAPAVGRSPRRLAQAALAVAADAAGNCSAYIGAPPALSSAASGKGGGGAMGDCAETVRDAADLLRQSAAELAGRVGRASSARFAWHLSNAQTWASAALTDAGTCLDSLATYGGGGGADVKRRVVAVEQATSNALAFVSRLQPPRRIVLEEKNVSQTVKSAVTRRGRLAVSVHPDSRVAAIHPSIAACATRVRRRRCLGDCGARRPLRRPPPEPDLIARAPLGHSPRPLRYNQHRAAAHRPDRSRSAALLPTPRALRRGRRQIQPQVGVQ